MAFLDSQNVASIRKSYLEMWQVSEDHVIRILKIFLKSWASLEMVLYGPIFFRVFWMVGAESSTTKVIEKSFHL